MLALKVEPVKGDVIRFTFIDLGCVDVEIRGQLFAIVESKPYLENGDEFIKLLNEAKDFKNFLIQIRAAFKLLI